MARRVHPPAQFNSASTRRSDPIQLATPGKRLRPMIVLLACQMCGGDIDVALPPACALEMVHSYSLVHDDLPAMDDDDLRRGQPTCHIKYGEATAILVGDALLTMAFEVVAGQVASFETSCRCLRVLSRAAGHSDLIGGQFDDLAAENRLLTIEELEAIHLRKTARLFSAAAELGGIVAGAADHERTRLSRFGLALGLSFQITDDLLDIQGNENRLGKRTEKDQTRGKSTYPKLIGIDASRQKACSLIEDAIRQLEPFGPAADSLRVLTQILTERTS